MTEQQQSRALERIYTLAKRELRGALMLSEPGDSAALAEVVTTYVPVIAERYGLAAGTLAADWYDDLREQSEVAGYFRAIVPNLPDQGRYEAMSAWVIGKDDVEALIAGGLQRVIADMHRGAVMESSFADPQAAGWARFSGGGDGSCPFCYMLISRGAVYDSATVKFGAHDSCNCQAGPVWKGRAGTQKVKQYQKSARRREGASGEPTGSTRADQARAREWIAEHL